MSDMPLGTTREVTNIELCDWCKGAGVIRREELECYHKGEYNVWYENCENCNGSGLVKRTITTIDTVVPYNPQKLKDKK